MCEVWFENKVIVDYRSLFQTHLCLADKRRSAFLLSVEIGENDTNQRKAGHKNETIFETVSYYCYCSNSCI